jgi:hypothetical protein
MNHSQGLKTQYFLKVNHKTRPQKQLIHSQNIKKAKQFME